LKSKQIQEFKETKIGRIPSDWTEQSIEDLLLPEKGSIKIGPFGSQIKKEFFVSKGFKVYGQENIFKDDFSIGSRNITKERFEFLRSSELKPGDLIISMMGTIGFVTIVPKNIKKGIMDSHLLRIRINESKCDKKFLLYALKSNLIQNQIDSYSVGTIMAGLNSQIIKKLTLPCPSIQEQQYISKILSDIDYKIKLLQQINETLEKIIQLIFKSWFIDSKLGKIPKGWNAATLNDVCSLITDGSHFSPKEDSTGIKRIATVKNMKEYDIDIQSCKKISNEDYKNLVKNGCKPQKTDVLFSKDGTMGIVHLFNGEENLVLLSSIAILRSNEKISNYYLKSYLSEEENQHILKEGYSSGSALPRIVLKDLKKFEIIVPTKEILKKFDLMVIPSYKQIFQNSKNCRVLKKVRDLLLQKLMSGEIRV